MDVSILHTEGRSDLESLLAELHLNVPLTIIILTTRNISNSCEKEPRYFVS